MANMETIKFDKYDDPKCMKGRTYKVPKGRTIVSTGVIKESDLVFNIDTRRWQKNKCHLIGCKIENHYAVARRVVA